MSGIHLVAAIVAAGLGVAAAAAASRARGMQALQVAALMNGKELAEATGQWPLATRE